MPAAPDIIADVLDSATPRARPEQPAATGPSRPRWAERVAMPGPMAVLLALTVLGAALRFGTLDVQSCGSTSRRRSTSSNAVSAGCSRTSPRASRRRRSITCSCGCGQTCSGPDALGFRSFSALAGTATVPVMYAGGTALLRRASACGRGARDGQPGACTTTRRRRATTGCWCCSRASRSSAGAGAASAATAQPRVWALACGPRAADALLRRLHCSSPRRDPDPAAGLAGRAARSRGVVRRRGGAAPLALQAAHGKAKWIEETSLVTRSAGGRQAVPDRPNGPPGDPAAISRAACARARAPARAARRWRRARGRDRCRVRRRRGARVPLISPSTSRPTSSTGAT